MRVALVNPGREQKWAVGEPLNIGYIAASLEQEGVEVRIIDELAGADAGKELEAFKPDYAGITATTPLAEDAYRVTRLCRELGITSVMGGIHSTVLPEEARKHADIVVIGEGESAFSRIIKEDLKTGVVRGEMPRNLDVIPPPARHLIDMEFYVRTRDRLGDIVGHLHFVPPKSRVGMILSSRGCPYKCTFCHNSFRTTPTTFHSPERVFAEIKELVEKYGAGYIFFADDNLLVKKERFRKVCELTEAAGLKFSWAFNTTGNHITPEMVELAVKSGAKQVNFGIESGSQRILDVLGKRTQVKKNSEALRLCKSLGLIVQASFIVGNPTETVEDIRMTQEFIRENSCYMDMIGVNIMTPYPGTKIWSDLRGEGKFPEITDWSKFCQDELPVRVCYEIEPDELKRLHLETASIKPMKFSRIWNRARLDPVQAVSVFLRSPLASFKILMNSVTRN